MNGFAGIEYPEGGSTRIGSDENRALLVITSSDAEAEAILDPEAVVVGSLREGYSVTAPWAVRGGKPMMWHSPPDGRLFMRGAGLSVSTCTLISACLAAPNRTVRIEDIADRDPEAQR